MSLPLAVAAAVLEFPVLVRGKSVAIGGVIEVSAEDDVGGNSKFDTRARTLENG